MFLFFKRLLPVLALIIFISISLKAQPIIQNVSGKIAVLESNIPLPGANVVFIESDSATDDAMALTRAGSFTVEETKQYAGLFNDPIHTVSGYALDELIRDPYLDLYTYTFKVAVSLHTILTNHTN